jgi:hypothetical protein
LAGPKTETSRQLPCDLSQEDEGGLRIKNSTFQQYGPEESSLNGSGTAYQANEMLAGPVILKTPHQMIKLRVKSMFKPKSLSNPMEDCKMNRWADSLPTPIAIGNLSLDKANVAR